MVRELSWQWHILILLQIVSLSFQLNHEFVPEREDLFSDCTDKPGFQNIDKIADLSQFVRKRNKNGGIDIHGNITMKWDVQPSDRVSVEVGILKLEKGTWKPTVFKGVDKDFCKSFYDKNTIYYPHSTEHVINKEEVKDKCVNIPGTVLIVEPFQLKILINYAVPLTPGRHKALIIYTAFDKANVKRPNEICMEIIGDIVKG
ncbi:uncharacterized protein LOC119560194 [Drosophila subpulchrella]|uniref:uncharacterized protein LOC119560194 n=1 Tax=Drosophila subpulchrella TaxID=1486046 RepID=UPI0018A12F03|nr:uncharacterized protein LOC119560194 [Drosophila subpulchrella]